MNISWNVCLGLEIVNVFICHDVFGFMYVCFFCMYTVECMYICLNVFMYLCIYMLASQTREREGDKSLEGNLIV